MPSPEPVGEPCENPNEPPPGAGPDETVAAEAELPPLEDLVKRLRPEVLAAMEEFFRAKWTGVKRVQQSDLKSG